MTTITTRHARGMLKGTRADATRLTVLRPQRSAHQRRRLEKAKCFAKKLTAPKDWIIDIPYLHRVFLAQSFYSDHSQFTLWKKREDVTNIETNLQKTSENSTRDEPQTIVWWVKEEWKNIKHTEKTVTSKAIR